MKYLLIILLCYCNIIVAQPVDQSIKLYHYAFNEFTPGIVKLKSREKYNQVLNYNILTNEMIFNNGTKYLAIARPENVDTVYIANRKFIFLNNKFYEVLINAPTSLIMEFTYTINEPGAPVGYGSTSDNNPSPSLKTLITTGGAYSLQLPDDFKITPGYVYWIMVNGEIKKFDNARQLIKIFPDKKDMIFELVRKNKTSFSSRDDIISLVKSLV